MLGERLSKDNLERSVDILKYIESYSELSKRISEIEEKSSYMEEKELLLKIENLEKRVSLLEKQLETISQINQSEKVKEYIASAEKASKIAKLLDVATDKKINDSPIGNATISDVLSNSPIMGKIEKAKEFVADVDSDVEKQIRENNDEANKYDWDTLFDYEEVDGQITIKSYIGFDDMDVVVIPDRINDLLVTKIGENAFENCKTVKKVILPVGLDVIGNGAFKGSGINSIVLPENLSVIEENAFSYSELESIHITSRVNKISSFSFCGCRKLKKLSFSNGITSIEYNAFASCTSLTKVDLPHSVQILGKEVFENIGGLNYSTSHKKVYIRIPDACEDIYGLDSYDNIFGRFVDNMERITIYCNAGSTAMKYARKHSIPIKRYEEFDLLEE